MRRYPAEEKDIIKRHCDFCKKATEQIILWMWNSDITQITKCLCLECVRENEQMEVFSLPYSEEEIETL